ncbi:MAG: DegT/DnrJ/EryC1/StrS family aminotransferase, partial [Anaerolineales bacterium]|nr:DegT/DnrJ/EryC1/StrS family aminotransferase [Anaerolineales bacterium]
MRKAMAAAEVGDDVYGEDPTVNKLEETAADRLGKEAGLLVASGTQGNLVAILAHANRGEEAIVGQTYHTVTAEAGGMAVLGGIVPKFLPTDAEGRMALTDIEASIRVDNPHYPVSRLILLENTTGAAGGYPLEVEYMDAVADIGHQHGLSVHVDGARLFNAAVALGVPASRVVQAADSATFCLSKGLSAPVGSVLCGSAEFIHRARRIRKLLGGGMRQAGV